MKISYFLLKLGSHFSGIRLQPCWELLSQHYLAFCPLKIRNKLALSFFFFFSDFICLMTYLLQLEHSPSFLVPSALLHHLGYQNILSSYLQAN